MFRPKAFLRSGRPLLLNSGLSEEAVLTLEENAKQELLTCAHECYVRVQNVFAFKRPDI
jgi:hypothetical protein